MNTKVYMAPSKNDWIAPQRTMGGVRFMRPIARCMAAGLQGPSAFSLFPKFSSHVTRVAKPPTNSTKIAMSNGAKLGRERLVGMSGT